MTLRRHEGNTWIFLIPDRLETMERVEESYDVQEAELQGFMNILHHLKSIHEFLRPQVDNHPGKEGKINIAWISSF